MIHYHSKPSVASVGSSDVNPALCHSPTGVNVDRSSAVPFWASPRQRRRRRNQWGQLQSVGVILGHRWRRSSEAGAHGRAQRTNAGRLENISRATSERWKGEDVFSTFSHLSYFSLLLVLEGNPWGGLTGLRDTLYWSGSVWGQSELLRTNQIATELDVSHGIAWVTAGYVGRSLKVTCSDWDVIVKTCEDVWVNHTH